MTPKTNLSVTHPDNPVYTSENGKIKRKRKPKKIKKIKTLKDLHDLFNVPEKYRVMDEDSIRDESS